MLGSLILEEKGDFGFTKIRQECICLNLDFIGKISSDQSNLRNNVCNVN